MLTFLAIAAGVGYLVGALPFGYLIARAKGVDIFAVGSRSPGATNVRRVLGPGPGGLVLVLDAAKGAVAAGWPLEITFAPTLAGSDVPLYSAVTGLFFALLGHSFSCFTRFRGGKGVATGAGGFAVLFPPGVLIALAVFALVVALTRYASLASMVSAATLPISAGILHRPGLIVGLSIAVVVFVILRHRANISRLLAGTESRIGGRNDTGGQRKP
jgi:glycerol-3-phosphate acyltransferase PlsY